MGRQERKPQPRATRHGGRHEAARTQHASNQQPHLDCLVDGDGVLLLAELQLSRSLHDGQAPHKLRQQVQAPRAHPDLLQARADFPQTLCLPDLPQGKLHVTALLFLLLWCCGGCCLGVALLRSGRRLLHARVLAVTAFWRALVDSLRNVLVLLGARAQASTAATAAATTAVQRSLGWISGAGAVRDSRRYDACRRRSCWSLTYSTCTTKRHSQEVQTIHLDLCSAAANAGKVLRIAQVRGTRWSKKAAQKTSTITKKNRGGPGHKGTYPQLFFFFFYRPTKKHATRSRRTVCKAARRRSSTFWT